MNISKIVLFPFAVLYDGITRAKNSLYNKGILPSTQFNLPVIVIGNITVGGTGKTPHTEFITQHLSKNGKTAVLSRGYGRKTKGFVLAKTNSTANEIGDEPLQISKSCPNTQVAVCEQRVEGITKLLDQFTLDYIVLDDAFQHRKLKGSYYILLTTYARPYFNDFVLPAGRLRETGQNKNRADLIVVTKCPSELSNNEREAFISKIQPTASQKVYFTSIAYGQPISLNSNFEWQTPKKAVLVTGIVDPSPLKQHIKSLGANVTLMAFADHYMYTEKDIQHIASSVGSDGILVTTSKDAVKLKPLLEKNNINLPAFELPITINVLFNQEKEFISQINKHVGII